LGDNGLGLFFGLLAKFRQKAQLLLKKEIHLLNLLVDLSFVLAEPLYRQLDLLLNSLSFLVEVEFFDLALLLL
jgi:hypothetical protein